MIQCFFCITVSLTRYGPTGRLFNCGRTLMGFPIMPLKSKGHPVTIWTISYILGLEQFEKSWILLRWAIITNGRPNAKASCQLFDARHLWLIDAVHRCYFIRSQPRTPLQLDVRITISELRNELARLREECRSKETGRTPPEPAEPGSERQPQRLGTDDAQTFENRMAFFALLAALTMVSLEIGRAS